MSRRPLRTLIAAPPAVAQTLAKALGELSGEVLGVATPEEAGPYLDRELDLILVCYVFDDLHPYKFINRIRNESPHKRTPVVLIRALPVPLGESQEWEIRRAYKSIGVNEFVNYSEMVHEKGSAHADAALRECIAKLT
jgi:CheY-like chemotaxis protein